MLSMRNNGPSRRHRVNGICVLRGDTSRGVYRFFEIKSPWLSHGANRSAHSDMAAKRFEIEKFDGETNFNLWQVRMMAILVQSGLKKVVTGKKPENLNKTEWEELDEKALSAIQLCLANTVLQEVLMEKTSSALWKRLETLYATKSLANSLVLKQRLFTFRMNERFEKLGHCVRDNHTRVNLAVYKSKARSLPVSKHRFDSVNSLHSSR
ncbi:hypothetical protein J1N35_007254 [Gossypium stocksii]|uniref:Retrovirus-related Pol polyprotein from transposon TNT 1-94 n=1 Tax=Gossypium stocksii TaxID=47602 RepID=A0A9D3W6A5_9ROSI|nr:hypothetical protein J1N35_007254 [Gossypium stocksii]